MFRWYDIWPSSYEEGTGMTSCLHMHNLLSDAPSFEERVTFYEAISEIKTEEANPWTSSGGYKIAKIKAYELENILGVI
jgi:hypothetical protein